MSGGLNKELLNGTAAFLRKYMIRSQSHYFFKLNTVNGKKELMSGVYSVNLVPAKHEPCPSVYIQTRSTWGTFSHQLKCFYLSAAPDQINSDVLTADVDWFFTDLMTGCQFVAYGNANAPNVEHNNNLSGNVNYGARVLNATHGGMLARVSPGIQYDPGASECGTVVGKRTGGNWTFYFQRMDAGRQLHLVTLPNP